MVQEELDEFERVLYYCIDKIYWNLKREREHLWKKLIDKSFGDDITEIMHELHRARFDIREAYKIQKSKPINK